MTTENKDMEDINILTDVLVIGGGFTAILSALEISSLGYRAVLIQEGDTIGKNDLLSTTLLRLVDDKDRETLSSLVDKISSDPKIDILTNTRLVSAAGLPGDFHLKLDSGTAVVKKDVGAIVLAPDFQTSPLLEAYELSESDNVWSQSKLEQLLESNDSIPGKRFAFLVGLAQEGNTLVMERVFRSIMTLQEKQGIEDIDICVGDLKVASNNLEKFHKKGREKGAVYYKLPKAPAIHQGKNLSIGFCDPILEKNIELSPDIIVVEEAVSPNDINRNIGEILGIHMEFGFLQKENVHRFPVNTNKKGIFVVGPGRDLLNLPGAFLDVKNMALEIKDLLKEGKISVPKGRAVVDRDKCAICLTCYRCCPHGAIYWDDKAIISPVACQACGTCASECPQDAIQIAGFEDDGIKKDINACVESYENELGSAKKDFPLIISFCCMNSAFEAGEMAKLFQMDLPRGLKMIKVSCAGKIDIDYIMTAFAQGADGVIVMTCHTGNCKSETGNLYAGWRVDLAKKKLEDVGARSDQLIFASLASNMGSEFSRITLEMEKKLLSTSSASMAAAG